MYAEHTQTNDNGADNEGTVEGARKVRRILAAATGNPADFFGTWLALQCSKIRETRAGLLVVRQGENSYVPTATWPDGLTNLTYLAQGAQQCLAEQNDLVRQGIVGTLVACPLEFDNHRYGAVVLDVHERSDAGIATAIEQLHWGVGWMHYLILQQHAQQDQQRLTRSMTALDMLGVAAEQPRLHELALTVCNELAGRFGCDRVAFGVERKGRVRLLGLSHSAFFEEKSQFVASLENAMSEALDQRRTIRWPLPDDGTSAGIAIAHREFAGTGTICSVPMTCRGRAVGVLSFEKNEGTPFPASAVAGFEAVCALLGPMVESRVALNRWFAGRLRDKLGEFRHHLSDPRRPALRFGLAITAVASLALLLIDGEYRVSARSVVEGEVQRSLVAPFEGFVRDAPIRAGMLVKKGQLLASLDDRDLRLDHRRWTSERDQHERRYRDALAQHERTSARVALAQVAEAQAQLSLVEEKLGRAQIVAPFDGIVVSGDLTQLLGSPVEQGKRLFEVAPLDAYRVILKVDDVDIRNIKSGQSGKLVLTGLAGQPLGFKVVNIAMPEAEDGRNLFRVEARLDRNDMKLRPGMEGVGKIIVGERAYGWIWTHRLFDWLRLQIWTWLP